MLAWFLPTVMFAFALAGPLGLFLSQERQSDARSGMPGMASFGGTPVKLATLDDRLASMYRGSKSHAEHFRLIPCFCGCDRTLEHRHLLDCFVLKNGSGWESHATGCSVCRGEARMALELLDQGIDPLDVRAQVIDEFGMPDAMKDMIKETT